MRGPCTAMKSGPRSPQLEKALAQQQRANTAKYKFKKKVAVGFFGLFVTFGSRICPNCTCTQLFLVPYSFFVFCCSRRGVSKCKNCSTAAKGPRYQAVSLLQLQPRLEWTPRAGSSSRC